MPLLGFVRTRRGFRDDSYLKPGLQIRYVAGKWTVKACRGWMKKQVSTTAEHNPSQTLPSGDDDERSRERGPR